MYAVTAHASNTSWGFLALYGSEGGKKLDFLHDLSKDCRVFRALAAGAPVCITDKLKFWNRLSKHTIGLYINTLLRLQSTSHRI